MREIASELHSDTIGNAGRRGVLYELADLGPQTVPAMARRRPVSRQHIQTIVSSLVEDGLVELRPNPAHLRSHLVELTRAGERAVVKSRAREGEVLTRLPRGLTTEGLEQAAATLAELRKFLNGTHGE